MGEQADYGEPWVKESGPMPNIVDRDGEIMVYDDSLAHDDADYMARVVACVNACAGMKDPAAEIKRLRALEVAKSDQAKAAKYLSSLAGFVTTLGGFAPVPLNADWREVQRKANEEFEARVKNAPTNGDPRSGYDAEGNMRGCFDPTGKFWPFLFIPGQPFGSRREIERGEGRILDACPVNPENMAPPEPPSTLPDPVL